MKGKSPLIWAIVFVGIVVAGIFYAAIAFVINPAFDKVERQRTALNASRAADALASRIDLLQFKVTDWASWDDTYNFVENHNAAYIKSNLQNNSLANLGINYMLFYNEHQQLVEKKGVDVTSGDDTTTPSSLLEAFKPGSKLLAKDTTTIQKGLLEFDDQSVQFVAAPILTSDGDGPLHGTIVFAQVLSPSNVKELADVTHLQLAYWRINEHNQPSDINAAIGTNGAIATATKELSANTIVGYQVIKDIYGKPALVARVEQTRDIHRVAQTAILQFALIMCLIIVLTIIAFSVLFNMITTRDKTIALKNEFFSIANHELRTPLTVIRNYAQLMKFQFSKQINDPKFDHMADSIDQAGQQLIGVVNVYLDAARLEAGKIPFTAQPFSLSSLANNLAAQLRATAKTKGVSVNIECAPELPQVLADAERVQQVILNLFGNALKFTENGTITIKGEADKNNMNVYVTDTGRGMDMQAQAQLFQRFKQTEAKDALRGSGLGLFISKKLVEQMGGSIRVASSAPGIGTTLVFTLPLAPPTPVANPAPAPEPLKGPPSSGQV
jgi:signal transduction histidine kinase